MPRSLNLFVCLKLLILRHFRKKLDLCPSLTLSPMTLPHRSNLVVLPILLRCCLFSIPGCFHPCYSSNQNAPNNSFLIYPPCCSVVECCNKDWPDCVHWLGVLSIDLRLLQLILNNSWLSFYFFKLWEIIYLNNIAVSAFFLLLPAISQHLFYW